MAKVSAVPIEFHLEIGLTPDANNFIEVSISQDRYESKLIERWEPVVNESGEPMSDDELERKKLVLKELRRFQKNIDDEVEEFLKRINR